MNTIYFYHPHHKWRSFLTGFTFLKRVFKEGILLVDKDSDLRTDIIENVSLKYRECTGLLAEASLG